MKLIIGGAWQGKTEYAKEKFSLCDKDIFCCESAQINFDTRCIDNLEKFTFECVKNNVDATAFFKENYTKWQDKVIICQDIFCGVVPLGVENRAWRQQTGRLCQYLSQQAETVTRIFCGMEQKLK